MYIKIANIPNSVIYCIVYTLIDSLQELGTIKLCELYLFSVVLTCLPVKSTKLGVFCILHILLVA